MTRYTASRWCRECGQEAVLDIVVEETAVYVQCLGCLSSYSLDRFPQGNEPGPRGAAARHA